MARGLRPAGGKLCGSHDQCSALDHQPRRTSFDFNFNLLDLRPPQPFTILMGEVLTCPRARANEMARIESVLLYSRRRGVGAASSNVQIGEHNRQPTM